MEDGWSLSSPSGTLRIIQPYQPPKKLGSYLKKRGKNGWEFTQKLSAWLVFVSTEKNQFNSFRYDSENDVGSKIEKWKTQPTKGKFRGGPKAFFCTVEVEWRPNASPRSQKWVQRVEKCPSARRTTKKISMDLHRDIIHFHEWLSLLKDKESKWDFPKDYLTRLLLKNPL